MDEVVIERISWRGIGELIGWVAFIENVVLIGFSVALLYDPSTYLFYLAITLLGNISWLYGNIQYKIFYMLIALLWWLIPMSICINYTIASIVKLTSDVKTNTKDNDTLAVTILSCGFVTFYILAALSFAAMWRNARQYNA